jgi:hypothetical protein
MQKKVQEFQLQTTNSTLYTVGVLSVSTDMILIKAAYFSNIYHIKIFQDPILKGSSATGISGVHTTVMLISVMTGI